MIPNPQDRVTLTPRGDIALSSLLSRLDRADWMERAMCTCYTIRAARASYAWLAVRRELQG